MNIIKVDLQFNSILTKRKTTNKIVLHHSASSKATPLSIHQAHLRNGWSGIGYHYLVCKDGKVYSGRPYDTVGAHCTGQNADSIGICFEGNFEIEKMTDTQVKAGQELLFFLRTLYGQNIRIAKHSDLLATACPGRYFPFAEVTKKMRAYTGVFPELPKKGYFERGDKGLEVARLKAFLNWYGDYELSTTPKTSVGERTLDAINQFKRDHNLNVNGRWGTGCDKAARECIK